MVKAEEFVAKKIGHDTARTSYKVDRTRHATSTPEHELRALPVPAADAPRRETASSSLALGR